jgi:crotonobetainyl-CoA:carnitine CoA-transferase CaiB-like acyl-CoA transferase
MTGLNIKLAKTPGELRLPAPMLGQHTREVLHALGYRDEDIDQLKAAGVI